MSVTLRVRLAKVLIVLTLIGGPASYLVPEKYKQDFILGLSWLAITLTAVDVLATQTVNKDVLKEEESD